MDIALITLGCPKNLVDAEVMLGLLDQSGHRLVGEPDGADVAIVNTCAFIASAVQESSEVVRSCLELKAAGRLGRVVVAGCLAQRYGDALFRTLPGVDGVVGCSHFGSIVDAVAGVEAGDTVVMLGEPLAMYDHTSPRILGTPSHIAYIKIAEGCNNVCSYCTIPTLRGPLRSRPLESILAEARDLAASGVVEANIIAQDTTAYGTDIAPYPTLAELLVALARTGITWVRTLYTHPARITDKLLAAMNYTPEVVHYIDLPIQHVSDGVLERMGRRTSGASIRRLVDRIRERVEDVAVRSSVMVGFPGETESDFRELLSFVRGGAIDHLGIFEYSPEPGTPAAGFADLVPGKDARDRADALRAAMEEVVADRAGRMRGKVVTVLVDDVTESISARTAGQAWEMDGHVNIVATRASFVPRPGTFHEVAITGGEGFDLLAEPVSRESA